MEMVFDFDEHLAKMSNISDEFSTSVASFTNEQIIIRLLSLHILFMAFGHSLLYVSKLHHEPSLNKVLIGSLAFVLAKVALEESDLSISFYLPVYSPLHYVTVTIGHYYFVFGH